jgi:hypothetical protein
MRLRNYTEQQIHFGTISIVKAKALYANGNYSLIIVLLYIDSRKQKAENGLGYHYPFEYNAPDIHHNAGVGLKAINKHLQMLEQRGALETIKDTAGNPVRTRKGAKKYKVVKREYEEKWGPSSNASLQVERQPEASKNAGQSKPSDESQAITSPVLGQSGPSANALRPGHSEPTNDNELVREEKSCEKKEDCSGFASPPLKAPASALPAQKSGDDSKSFKSISSQERDVAPLPPGVPSSADYQVTPPDDPLDPYYKIPASYVDRYHRHHSTLDQHIRDNPGIGIALRDATDQEAGKIVVQLLNTLQLY